jgi:hypothetical protein
MREWLIRIASLLLVGAPITRGTAQQIRGVVTDSAAGTPIAGAVVMLMDADGAALARTLTSAAGEYSLFSAASSVATLRIRRLGFRPRDVTLPASLPARMDVRLARVATLLQPVRVAVAANCPRRSDREAAYALLEQARSGLLATVVARSVSPAISMTRLDFRRWMDGNSADRADSMIVTFDSVGRTSGSYEAVKSARQFLRDGFLFEFGDTVHYLAPDADVLLDEGFGQGYCFHIRREASRPSQLGLAFLPARRVRDRVDVDGTLWVDTLARELRDIEFKYLGLSGRSDDATPGGRIAFWTMPNGLVFIDSWHLRWPRPVAETTYVSGPGGPAIRSWIEATEGGGEVARAMWADSSTFSGSLGTLHGRAVDAEGRGVGNVVIRLRGTDYVASPGIGGYFEIGHLVPGPYIADVVDPAIAHLSITFPTALRFTAKRDSVTDVRVLIPSTPQYVLPNCDGRSWPGPDRAPGMLVVKVLSGNKPVANVPWEIRRFVGGDWQYITERRRTREDGIAYTCLRYQEGDEVEVRVFEADASSKGHKISIGRRGTTFEVQVPPGNPKPPNRPSAERLRNCLRDTVGEPCVSSPQSP